MAAPSWRQTEMETAKEWGVPWQEWVKIEPLYRGQMIAHEMVMGKRRRYLDDQRKKRTKPDKGGQNAYTAMQNHFSRKE